MNPSRLFIMRPVATALSMVAIVLAGALAYRLLPVSALPQVDYPTIQVLTFYPGAGPDVMASSVTAPLERQFVAVAEEGFALLLLAAAELVPLELEVEAQMVLSGRSSIEA